ncbi:GNAT family protein [Bacillus niameyensis]|uniref:hypothetical protein n=1 Tax=Bacillus niameyensis TaxID=1522308 RepID=UPI000AEDFBC9|nr:hypothetical protein [Bacillus niameyensis]
MKIIKFRETDTEEIVSLFYKTVHSINSKDYFQQELDAWAPEDEKNSKVESWKVSLSARR